MNSFCFKVISFHYFNEIKSSLHYKLIVQNKSNCKVINIVWVIIDRKSATKECGCAKPRVTQPANNSARKKK